jgi:hypothetical protein
MCHFIGLEGYSIDGFRLFKSEGFFLWTGGGRVFVSEGRIRLDYRAGRT